MMIHKKHCFIKLCILLSLICTLLCSCGNSIEKAIETSKGSMTTFITDEAIPAFNQCGISDIEASEIVFEDGYALSDRAALDCYVKLTSKEISAYADTRETDKEEIAQLLNIFRSIYDIREGLCGLTQYYKFNEKSVSINFCLGKYSSDIIIIDDSGNIYDYGKDTEFETLYINDTVLFEDINYGTHGSTSSGTNNSYSGSYDAKLKYSGTDGVLICISEDAMDRFMTAVNNDNQGTLEELFADGQVAYTEQGTKCNIVEKKFSKAQVKLLDGSYAGNTVWVVIESLQEE